MHEDITEHVAYERGKNEKRISSKSGYDIGVEDGRKRAWDLVGEAADWYLKQYKQRLKNVEAPDDICLHVRHEVCLYIQQVIKKDCL